jgi:hypothetical protein
MTVVTTEVVLTVRGLYHEIGRLFSQLMLGSQDYGNQKGQLEPRGRCTRHQITFCSAILSKINVSKDMPSRRLAPSLVIESSQLLFGNSGSPVRLALIIERIDVH